MPVIKLTTKIHALPHRVFDLARSVDLHQASMTGHGEQIVGGVNSGLINFGESVTWRARHFGLWWSVTSQITAFERPAHFRDTMVSGPFERFDHDHTFSSDGDMTQMKDVFDYTSPLGALGRMADFVFLERYMIGILMERNAVIKVVAGSDQWRNYLHELVGGAPEGIR